MKMIGRHPLLALVVLGLASGCSQITKAYEDVTGSPGSGEPGRFYVATDGTPLYAEPSFSSSRRAVLARGDAVDRDKIDHGFAHVVVVSTDASGWIDNAKLVWQRPGAKTPAKAEPAKTEPAAVASEPEPAPAPAPAPKPTPAPDGATSEAPVPEATQAPAAPAAASTDDLSEKPVDPALFDAF